MSTRMRAGLRCAASISLLASVVACGSQSMTFYEVTRTPTEECDILPQGEFCVSLEELSPPVQEVWAVEFRDDEVRVFVQEEVWVGDPLPDSAEPGEVRSSKQEFVTVSPGACSTTTTRELELLATWADLTGLLRERTRQEGPEACGETPRGERTTSRIDGFAAGAP